MLRYFVVRISLCQNNIDSAIDSAIDSTRMTTTRNPAITRTIGHPADTLPDRPVSGIQQPQGPQSCRPAPRENGPPNNTTSASALRQRPPKQSRRQTALRNRRQIHQHRLRRRPSHPRLTATMRLLAQLATRASFPSHPWATFLPSAEHCVQRYGGAVKATPLRGRRRRALTAPPKPHNRRPLPGKEHHRKQLTEDALGRNPIPVARNDTRNQKGPHRTSPPSRTP